MDNSDERIRTLERELADRELTITAYAESLKNAGWKPADESVQSFLLALRAENEQLRKEREFLTKNNCNARSWIQVSRELEETKADLARANAAAAEVLNIIRCEVALEGNEKPGDCRASHNRANNILAAVEALSDYGKGWLSPKEAEAKDKEIAGLRRWLTLKH